VAPVERADLTQRRLVYTPKDFPDHHDADLVLKLYDLRREPVMRQAREEILGKYVPKSADEAIAVLNSSHPMYKAFSQVSTYWEMAFGFAKHGVLHPEFMLESSSEGILLYSRVEPYLEKLRESRPRSFRNAEWITSHTQAGKTLLEAYRARLSATAVR
jgi:hypothetical protein